MMSKYNYQIFGIKGSDPKEQIDNILKLSKMLERNPLNTEENMRKADKLVYNQKVNQDLDEFYKGPPVKAGEGLSSSPQVVKEKIATITIPCSLYSNLLNTIEELTKALVRNGQ